MAPPALRSLTCVITLWLAFLQLPRPSVHKKRIRKQRESSPSAQPPAPNELRGAVPARPLPPRARRAQARGPPQAEVHGRAAQPAHRGPLAPRAARGLLQPRRSEPCACPSPRRRAVFMAPSADLCRPTRSLLRSRSLLLWALLSAARPATHITLPPQTRGSVRRRAGRTQAWRAAPPEAALGDHGGPRPPARRGSPAPLWPSTPAAAAASLRSQRAAPSPARLTPKPRGLRPARLPRASASSSPARCL